MCIYICIHKGLQQHCTERRLDLQTDMLPQLSENTENENGRDVLHYTDTKVISDRTSLGAKPPSTQILSVR